MVKTIRIKDAGFPDGLVINESDFDEETMAEFKGKSDASKTAKAEEKTETSTTPKRCQFTKGNDEQCGNDALEGSDFCHIKSHK